MHYKINIAKNNEHYFAIAEHSLKDFKKANEVYKDLLQKFPSTEGFKLELTRWDTIGTVITRNGYGAEEN
jgi:hypothetical protein